MKLIRKITRNSKWFGINIIGLTVAFTCILIVSLYIRQELSYDRFHSKADRIYRVTLDSNNGSISSQPARVAGDAPKKLASEFPAIEKMVRLIPFKKAVIKIGDQRFYSEETFSTDSSFFDVFDFKVLSGNPQKAFAQPGRVYITRSLAMKYFGSIQVIGREITILHQQDPKPRVYTVEGVMENFPVNSHFHADLLTSLTEMDDKTTWAYTYFLMKKGTDVKALQNTIQEKWLKERRPGEPIPILYLQKLTDIHLFSHKSREIEKNGDIRFIILLFSSLLIITGIAFINFMNLNRVQFIAGIKSLRVKMNNGASKWNIATETLVESLVLSFISILIGLFLSIKLGPKIGMSIFIPGNMESLLLIILGFSLIIAILSLLPLLTSKVGSGMNNNRVRGHLYPFPLLIQFVLSVVAIAGTIALNRQMNYLISQHPESQNQNMLVIANNPWEVVQRYETLKQELLKNPAVTNMTAVMEEPGGDILDAFGFEMEGMDQKKENMMNILTTDSNFFSMFEIHPLAGTVNLGYTPSQPWEADAVELSTLRTSGNPDKQKIEDLEKRVTGYQDKYILNLSALRMIGIKNPEDAIGKRFRLVNFYLQDLFPTGIIVGVVPDFHYTNLRNKEKPLAIAAKKLFSSCFIIGIDPLQRRKALEDINLAWRKINPDYPLQAEYLTQSYQKIYAGEFTQTRILSLFALISIILSSLGIFAMASFNLQRRVKEIGIRKVNGAKIIEIIYLLNRDLVRWVLLAIVISPPIAWYSLHKWLANFAYKTELSWWIFATAGLLALGIALLTISWQSWRAAARNPVESLRYE